jgi:hypothetical protein
MVGTGAALVTVIVYVAVVVPSCAVPITVIVFAPSLREMLPEATPEATGVPSTVIVAFPCVRVGVIVIDVVLFATETV